MVFRTFQAISIAVAMWKGYSPKFWEYHNYTASARWSLSLHQSSKTCPDKCKILKQNKYLSFPKPDLAML